MAETRAPASTPPAAEARLRQLAALLDRLRATARHVGYAEAEGDSERLAALLVERCGRSWIDEAACAAIPRGGLFVLGMLAYHLDLRSDQLLATAGDPEPTDRPLLLVDDCALTGARLAATLPHLAASRIVVAHLYSHPELRRALVAAEPRVERCVAAYDLTDQAPSLFAGAEHAAWRRRWEERLGGGGAEAGRYWLGVPEMISFAWSEPDRPFWNPSTGEVEDGWRFSPPQECLKNRARLGLGPRSTPTACWRVPPAVVAGEFDGQWWLCRADSGEISSLDGLGGEIWRRLARGDELEAVIAALQADGAADAAELRRDVASFARRLLDAGLLERVPAGAGGEP